MKIVRDLRRFKHLGWNGLEFGVLSRHRRQGLPLKTKRIYFRMPNMKNSCTKRMNNINGLRLMGPLALGAWNFLIR